MKIILITHQKGGVGKSTLTFNLANNLAKKAKVAVLDFDLQGSLSQIKSKVKNFDIITFEGKTDEISNLEYDFIFIDTPPYLSDKLGSLMKIADLIIIPTKAGILDLLAIKSTIDLIHSARKTDSSLIVFNMIKPNTTLTLDILLGIQEYSIEVANTYVSDLVAFTRSVLLNGVEKDKNAQNQLDKLTKEVLQKLL